MENRIDFASADKNKSAYKLQGLPKVLWINLDRYTERREYMEGQFKYWEISDHHRIPGVDGRDDDPTTYLKGKVPSLMNPGEIGCVVSHLNAVKYFVEETDLDEIMIMEDDVDLNIASYWGFTWNDVRKRMPINFDACQFTIINPLSVFLTLHHRFINDFSAACYLLTRHHAEKILRMHKRGDRWKIDQNILPRAVSEDLILDSGKTYATPLFNYRLDLGSAIHTEHIDVFHKSSCTSLTQFWKSNGVNVKIDDVMKLDAYTGRIPPTNSEESKGS